MDWDINWADREWVYDVFDHVHLDHWQRVNHYRNGREVGSAPQPGHPLRFHPTSALFSPLSL